MSNRPTFKIHDHPALTTTKRANFVTAVASKSRWNGGKPTRDIANHLGWELASVSNMLHELEKDSAPIEVTRTVTPGGKSQIVCVRYVAPDSQPAPVTPAPAEPTTGIHPVVEALLRELVSQLDYQRTQLDSQAQELLRLREDLQALSVPGKLDYIASKCNAIHKKVGA